MKRSISTKPALLKCALSLLLCVSMLVGSTFAWFTDEVTSAGNIIQSGSLDINMQWATAFDGENTVWNDAAGENAKPVFDYQNWEPGYTEVRYIKVTNEGNLAFKWLMSIIPVGEVGKLAEAVDVSFDIVTNNTGFVAPTTENKFGSLKAAGTLANVIAGNTTVVQGVLLPEGEEKENFYSGELVACIALHMRENAGNEYQGTKIGDSFNILLRATQYNHEEDFFDANYDVEATYPSIVTNLELTQNVSEKVEDGKLTEEITFVDSTSGVKVVLPVGTSVNSETLTLKIIEDGVDNNITLDQRVAYDVSVEGVASDNEAVILVTMPAMLPAEMTAVQLFHDGVMMHREFVVSEVEADEFYYDSNTGDVTFGLKHFSNISAGASISVYVNGQRYDGVEIKLNDYMDEPVDSYIEGNYNLVIPNDGNTYILTFDSGDRARRNMVKFSGTWHESYNLNPGDSEDDSKQWYPYGIIVEDGATVILNNASIRADWDLAHDLRETDAIRIGYELSELEYMNANGIKYFRGNGTKTKILVADGSYNCLLGNSGIGFGYYTGADVYIEGQGALYTASLRNACPGIGVSYKTDGGATTYAESGPKVNINVGWLVVLPMQGAAGIGGGFRDSSWNGLSRIVINGGSMQVYSGADAAAIGGAKVGNTGEIVINGGKIYLYCNPANTQRTTLGMGHYGGSCKGIYISKDAYIYYGTAMSWEDSYADEKVNGFIPLDSITVAGNDGLGNVTKLVGNFGGTEVELTKYNVVDNNNAKKVTANAVYYGGNVYYVPGASTRSADFLVAQSLTVSGYKEAFAEGDTFEQGDDFVATLRFSDGSTMDVTDKVEFSGFDSSTPGVDTVTVTYGFLSTTYTTRVIAPVKLTVEPKRSLYNVGEVKPSDFKVTVYDSTGVATTLSDFNISVDGNINAPGNVNVTVSKDNLSATCTILLWNMTKLEGNKMHTMHYNVPVVFNVSGWSNHTLGTNYLSLVGQTHTIPGTEEVVTDFSFANNIRYNASSPTNFVYTRGTDGNLTVKNASRYTTLGVEYWLGYDVPASAVGYYFDGDMSTLQFTSPVYDIDPTNDYYKYLGTYGFRTNYLTCDLYSFKPGSTHTVHWVAIFNDGIQTFAEWKVTLKVEDKDDASYEEDPSKPYVNVIVLAGQSNAAGSAPITDDIRAQYSNKQFSNVFINYINQEAVGNTVTTYFTNGNNFDMYKLGIGGFGANYFGPELGLADYLATNAPNETWYIIKYAPSGSELDRQWFGEAKIADRMIGYVKERINILSKDYNVKMAGFVWMQGESDAAGLAAGVSGRYSSNEQKLMKMVRDEFAAYATRNSTALNTPGSGIVFVNGGIATTGVWPEHEIVNNAKKANCSWWYDPIAGSFVAQETYNIANSVFVDTNTLISKNQSYLAGSDNYGNDHDNNDQAHYSDESMANLGTWFGSALRSMMINCP